MIPDTITTSLNGEVCTHSQQGHQDNHAIGLHGDEVFTYSNTDSPGVL